MIVEIFREERRKYNEMIRRMTNQKIVKSDVYEPEVRKFYKWLTQKRKGIRYI